MIDIGLECLPNGLTRGNLINVQARSYCESGQPRTFVGRSAPTDGAKGTLHMTASPPPPVPRLVRALMDVREILERARRTDDRREIEAAIERINATLDGQD